MKKRKIGYVVLGIFMLLSACVGLTSDTADSRLISEANKLHKSELLELSGSVSPDPSMVHLVDVSTTNNMLFRGNLPIQNNEFQYDNLVKAMTIAAARQGKRLPLKYKIVDVTLLNDLIDREPLNVERSFFEKNPDLGYVVWHPIYGALFSPNDFPASVRKEIEKVPPELSNPRPLIAQLNDILTNKSDVPLLIYVHCVAGKDRTGEIIGDYSLRYMGVSYLDAMKNAVDIAGRPISKFSRNGLQWYAYYISDYQGITTVGPITN